MECRYKAIAIIFALVLCSSVYCSDQCLYSTNTNGPPSTICDSKIHDCNLFNEKVLTYVEKLEPYYEKIKSNETLSVNEVETAIKIVKEYYNYLINEDIVYAKLASDVINNQGPFVRIANDHLKYIAKVEGKLDQITNIENNIRIALAYSDAKLRSECTKFLPYEAIAKYHYDVFESQGLSKLAWGGALYEEFAGSGSYLNVGGYDKRIDFKLISLMKALIFNKESNGIKAREALHSILSSYRDSATASICRPLLTFKPTQKTLKSFSAPNSRTVHLKNKIFRRAVLEY